MTYHDWCGIGVHTSTCSCNGVHPSNHIFCGTSINCCALCGWNICALYHVDNKFNLYFYFYDQNQEWILISPANETRMGPYFSRNSVWSREFSIGPAIKTKNGIFNAVVPWMGTSKLHGCCLLFPQCVKTNRHLHQLRRNLILLVIHIVTWTY